MYSSAGNKLSGLSACTIRPAFFFFFFVLGTCFGSGGSSLALEGAQTCLDTWLGAEQAPGPTSNHPMLVRAQCMGAQALGATGATAAGGENVCSECQLLMGSLQGFKTLKKMFLSCCFPVAIRVMFNGCCSFL